MGKKLITVGLVEDEPMTLKQFQKMIEKSSDLELLFAETTLSSSADKLSMKPDVLVTDLNLPDGSGIDLIRLSKQVSPATEIIVISVMGDAKSVVNAVESGATGYLLKDAYSVELVQAIKELINGGSPISAAIARHILERFQGTPEVKAEENAVSLSTRESEVLSLIAMGYSYKDIAKKIGISSNTVPTYIKNIYRKLEVTSRGEAVFTAMRQGLLDIRHD